MLKKLIQGVIVSTLVLILPVMGNTAILQAPHLWILMVFGILASVLQPDYNPLTIAAASQDRGTGSQIIWSVYATQLAAVLECAYLRYPQSIAWDKAATAALVIMAMGLALRTWSVATLGGVFTMHISIREDHAVIRSGPYRIIRHPSYLGAFMLYLSSTVFLHAWISAAATLSLLLLAFMRRIRREEEVLIEEFGEAYRSYRSDVRMVLPGVW